jgi:hypothetical protein
MLSLLAEDVPCFSKHETSGVIHKTPDFYFQKYSAGSLTSPHGDAEYSTTEFPSPVEATPQSVINHRQHTASIILLA